MAAPVPLARRPPPQRPRRRGADLAPTDGRLLDQYLIGWFHELNRQLNDMLDADAFVARMGRDVERMHDLALELLAHARRCHPSIGDHGLDLLLDGRRAPDEPLLPAVWYAEHEVGVDALAV